MDMALSSLFADDGALPAFAAVLCATAAALGLRLYQRDFQGRTDTTPHWTLFAATVAAGAAMGLFLAGAHAEAGTMALAQAGIVTVHMIRDLRRIVAEGEMAMRRKNSEIADLAEELALYKAAFAENAQKFERAETGLLRLQRYEDAIENMAHGLAIFDADDRLVLCNTRFAEIHALPPDCTRAGASHEQILAHRMRDGEFPGHNLESAHGWHRRELAHHKRVTMLATRGDGRTVDTDVRLLPNGSSIATSTDVSELRLSLTRSFDASQNDVLTGLPGRPRFMQHLDGALARARRTAAPLGVLVLDLDHFNAVNTALGPQIGDKLLQQVAERLRELMRASDIIARMGDNCFAIAADALTQDVDAALLGHRLLEVLATPFVIDGHQVLVSASIGISIAPHEGDEPELLVRNAETALRQAKAEGRDTLRFFASNLDTLVRTRRTLEGDLRTALGRGEFELYFQPLVSLHRHEVTGLEALIRWHHPVKGLQMPADFLGFAEESGLIEPIGRWAIWEACARAAEWHGELKVAVNVSKRQLRDPELVRTIQRALINADLAPERLEIDVPELAFIDGDAGLLEVLNDIRSLGVRIVLDEFGAGHTSLSYLQSFPFDKIKIARCFVKDVAEKHEPLFMLRAVATLADGLRIETTAKGVETQKQLAAVRAQNCAEAQGYLFGKPMPAQEVEAFLAAFDDEQHAPVTIEAFATSVAAG